MSLSFAKRISKPLRPREQRDRLFYLAIVLLPLMGSYALQQGIQIPHWGCPLLHWTGVPCPGWGLTRSFVAMARGDWQAAIGFHAFGPVLFGSMAIACLHLMLELIAGQRFRLFYEPLLRSPRFQIFIFLLLLGYHSIRLYNLMQSGLLLNSFLNSPLGRGLT